MSAPPSVCLVPISYPPKVGGVSRSAERHVDYLREAGFRVEVFVPTEGPGGRETGAGGVRVHRVPGLPQLWPALTNLRAAVAVAHEASPFDLFHAFYLTTAFAAGPVARGAARPLLISIHGTDATQCVTHAWLRAMAPPVLRRAAWVTAVAAERLRLVQGLVDLGGRCSVIPNSVPPAPPPAWALTEANRGVVGTVGQFRPVKDVPLLIEAYAGLPSGLRRGLRLVGDFVSGDERRQAEEQLRQSGVAGEAGVTGYLDSAGVTEALRGLNVFALSSRWEGLPHALLEAAALGTPVVATAVGGIPEVLRDGEEALLVPPGDAARLREALAAVLGQPELAEKLSHGARRAADRLRPEAEREAWLRLYRQLLSPP